MSDHYIDPHSGALIFPRSPLADVTEAQQVLRDRVGHLEAVVMVLVEALPKAVKEKIPAQLLEGLSHVPATH